MSRNGQGVYVLPSGNPVVTGTVITSTWANVTMADIATALTGSVASDGQTVMTGNLQMGNQRITGLADGVALTDAATVSQLVNVNITSGSINGVVIGNIDPPVATFQTLTVTNTTDFPTLPIQDSTDKVATTRFVHDLVGAGGELKIILAFGISKTPAQLPTTGLIPKDWDSVGNPPNAIQFTTGDVAIYNLAVPSAQDYNDCYSFSNPMNLPNGTWVNIGPVEGAQGPIGPEGPQGAQGVQGIKGDKGDQGAVGPVGQTGNDGPQGIAGPIGPEGPQGDRGPAGEAATIVGSFGASKTPADLPPDGLIPANWDSVGNPPQNEQLTIGQALLYTEVPKTNPLYGHVFSYVGTDFDPQGWVDAGDIVGPQGPQGDTGPQGPAGNNGTDGQQGPKGDQGIQGNQGPQGVQGPQGPAGTDATVSAASVISALGYTPASNEGTNVSGTWAINITGNANSATSAVNVTGIIASNATGTTQPLGTNNQSIATTAFVLANQGGGGGAVQSVNGKTGVVNLTAADVNAYPSNNPNSYTTLAAVAAVGYTTLAAVQAQGYTTLNIVQQQGYQTATQVNTLITNQLTNYVNLNAAQTISGVKTFSGGIHPTYTGDTVFAGGLRTNGNLACQTALNFGPLGQSTPSIFSTAANKLQIATLAGATAGNQQEGPNFSLFGAGNNGFKAGGGAWADNSDSRLKDNVQTLTTCLNVINQLNPVMFTWKIPSKLASGAPEVGFIADEVEQVIPSAVCEIMPFDYGNGDNSAAEIKAIVGEDTPIKCVGFKNDMFAYLVGAIKELSAEVEALKAK